MSRDNLARELGKRKIAFLFARESLDDNRLGPQLKAAFGGPFIANEKFSLESAQSVLEAGEADAVAWGQLYIANPDLPRCFALNAPLNAPNPSTYYAGGETGYTDYPSLESVA